MTVNANAQLTSQDRADLVVTLSAGNLARLHYVLDEAELLRQRARDNETTEAAFLVTSEQAAAGVLARVELDAMDVQALADVERVLNETLAGLPFALPAALLFALSLFVPVNALPGNHLPEHAPVGEHGFAQPWRDAVRELIADDDLVNARKRYFTAAFGCLSMEVLVADLGRSESELLHQARVQNLRKLPYHWSAAQAANWLGVTEEDLSKYVLTLAARPSSGRHDEQVLPISGLRQFLADNPEAAETAATNADPAFWLEALTVLNELDDENLSQNKQVFEDCQFLDGSHVCRCPLTVSQDCFCDGNDPYCKVRTLNLVDIAADRH